MKKSLILAAIAVGLSGVQVAVGQEADEVAADDLQPLEEEEISVLDKESLDSLDESAEQIRISVFRNAGYGGYQKTFYVSQGSRIDLKKSCGKLNNKISSLRIYGPRGTSATVFDKRLCYNCSTHSGTFWARSGGHGVDKRTLRYYGVHDRITRIYLQFDGYLLNNKVHYPSC